MRSVPTGQKDRVDASDGSGDGIKTGVGRSLWPVQGSGRESVHGLFRASILWEALVDM